MTLELLLLTPYAAIGASLLLVITVATTCHVQERSFDNRAL